MVILISQYTRVLHNVYMPQTCIKVTRGKNEFLFKNVIARIKRLTLSSIWLGEILLFIAFYVILFKIKTFRRLKHTISE